MIGLSQMPKTCFALSEFCLNFKTLSFCDDVHVLKGSPSGRLILTMHANSSFFEVVDYNKFWDKDKDKDKDKDNKLTQVSLWDKVENTTYCDLFMADERGCVRDGLIFLGGGKMDNWARGG